MALLECDGSVQEISRQLGTIGRWFLEAHRRYIGALKEETEAANEVSARRAKVTERLFLTKENAAEGDPAKRWTVAFIEARVEADPSVIEGERRHSSTKVKKEEIKGVVEAIRMHYGALRQLAQLRLGERFVDDEPSVYERER